MHVAQPDKPVALDSVPDVLLHIQMHRVCSCHPDVVEPLVAAIEGTLVRDVPVAQDRSDLLEVDQHVVGKQVQTDEAIACRTYLDRTIVRAGQFHVTHRVVIGGGVVLEIHDLIASGLHQ